MKTVYIACIALLLLCLQSCEREKEMGKIIPTGPEALAFDAFSARVGSQVTLRGKGFSPVPAENVVKFNQVVVSVSSATPTALTFSLPPEVELGENAISVSVKGVPADTSLTLRIFGWKKMGPAPLKRRGAFSFALQDKLYVGAGIDFSSTNGTAYQDFWSYAPATDEWTRLTDYPGGKTVGSVVFVIDNKAYVGLGYEAQRMTTREFYQYDPQRNQWTRVADFPGEGRTGTVAFALGGRGYVGTGNSNGITSQEDFYAFDPLQNNWTRVANFGGGPLYGAAAFTLQNQAYLVGGVVNNTQRINQCWAYDPVTDQWTRRGDFPGPAMTDGVSLSLPNRGFFGLGGVTNVEPGTALYEYHPRSNTWSEALPFPGQPRFGGVWGSVGGIALFGLGEKGTMQTDLWGFLPE